MKKILFEAINSEGKKIASFIDDTSNANALQRLKQMGYREIQFFNDASHSAERDYLAGKSEKQIQQIAKHELSIRKQGSKLSRFLIEVARNNRIEFIIYIILFSIGLYTSYYLVATTAALLFVYRVIQAIGKYQIPKTNQDAEKAYALGDYPLFLKKKAILQKHIAKPYILFYLDGREATILAVQGRKDEALALLEKWRSFGDESHPGLLESRIATIYQKTGDFKQALESRTLGYEKSGYSQISAIDLAMLEVRHGDLGKAEQLISQLRVEELSATALPFLQWINGLIAAKKGDESAESTVYAAVTAMLARGEQPVLWITLALCLGDYAALAKSDTALNNAEQLLSRYWPIYVAHGEKDLVQSLRIKYPSLPAA